MKHLIRIVPQAELALVRFHGRVDLSSLFEVLRALPGEGFEPDYKILWDGRGVGETVLRPGDLERLMKVCGERSGGERGREAAVVGRPLDYSVVHLYKALAQRRGYEVGVYWRLEEALAYLRPEGLPEVWRREALKRRPLRREVPKQEPLRQVVR